MHAPGQGEEKERREGEAGACEVLREVKEEDNEGNECEK